MHTRVAGLVLPALMGTAGRASASESDTVALGFDWAPVGDRAWAVQSPDGRSANGIRLRLAGDYAREPLVVFTPDAQIYRVVSDQTWTRASASLTLLHRWSFGIDVPLLIHQSGDARQSQQLTPPPATAASALGDVRWSGRTRVWGAPGAGWQVGVGADVWIPVGSQGAYAGEGSTRVRGFATAGVAAERWYLAFDVGLLTRPSRHLPGGFALRSGPAVTLGAAAGYAVDTRRHVHVGPELTGQFTVGEGARLFDPHSTRLQLLLGVRWRIAGSGVEVGGACGPGLARGPGDADVRALASIAWTPGARAPLPDQDDDGIADATDICPTLRGVHSSDPLMDGCPPVPVDVDGDAIPDQFDACPKVPGEPTGDRRSHGCPPSIDQDHDGILDPDDACPAVSGVAHADPTRNGCSPAPPVATLVPGSIAISEQVQFELGTSLLRAESEKVLEQVALVMRQHSEIELLEVQGHTDDLGSDELNERLSLERARTVARWLEAHGVTSERIVARGLGRSRPLADNTTAGGRAVNRRVEFLVRTRKERTR